MSLDDIILFEQKKKEALRAQSSEDEDCTEKSLPSRSQPEINMTLPDFPPHPANRNMFNRKPVNMSQNNWTGFRRKFGPQMPIRKHYNGIPLISMKRREGRPNSYTMWKQRYFGRNFFQRYYNPNQLTLRNLNRFNQQNPNFIKRGPGSTGSRGSRAGSVCTSCSQASVRSNTSFRSNRSRGSFRSYNNRSHLSSNRSSQISRSNRFVCYLNLNIQKQIRIMQEKKAIRVQNTSRENIVDEPTKCKPTPRTTGVSFNHRFKQFIANALDL